MYTHTHALTHTHPLTPNTHTKAHPSHIHLRGGILKFHFINPSLQLSWTALRSFSLYTADLKILHVLALHVAVLVSCPMASYFLLFRSGNSSRGLIGHILAHSVFKGTFIFNTCILLAYTTSAQTPANPARMAISFPILLVQK